ncbi:MAG: aldehyde ferredoxin oxidoreductase family protein [Deltaproteobacteria bacterium]|jgi:aldehyde:ferredoxin oxidoreductase|nr:aldehyde ferredoxin oxidoreductase family protein [Deltaproteobacteria bacterium]
MKGFFNRILRINLSVQTYKYDDLSDTVLKQTLGGKGLGAHLLMTENPVGVDSLSPDNIFAIVTGPVTGTKVWSQSRFGVFSKSPLTDGYGESYCGGSVAPKIKGCGVDAMIITGKSDQLIYLVINEEGVIFKSAEAIKGQETVESEAYILENAPKKAGAIVIGPAGENLVRFACVKSDRSRSLGRGGMGAVMGSKNLKGIAFAGDKKADVADPELLKTLIKPLSDKHKDSPVTAAYKTLGTPMQVAVTNKAGCFPTKYWSSGTFEKWEHLSADYMQENFKVKAHACPNCFLRCTKKSLVKNGRHQGLQVEGPEYETIYAIGGLNAIDVLEEVLFLNDVCDRLGLDTMSAGNISAFAVEAFKRGKSDYAIDYNQPDKIAELYQLIAESQGVGKTLGQGIKRASETWGLEDIAIHVKGMEPGGFDPRVLKGMGLSYATSARGACHLRGTFYKAELSGQMDKDQIKGKAKLQIDYEDRCALMDSMVLCRFFRDFIQWDELKTMIEATTGLILDKDKLEILANRITQQTRQYNIQEGLDESTDTLPPRFLKEATKEGAALSAEDLATMINEYNDIRKGRDE